MVRAGGAAALVPGADRTLPVMQQDREPHGPVPEHRGHDWPAHAGNPFDPELPWPGLFYWARGTPSRLFPADRVPTGDELYAAIPMGYTTLATLTRLSLFHHGRLLRAWEHGPSSSVALMGYQPYQVLLPPDDEGRYQLLGVNWPERFAVRAAEQLSARVDGPVLLCRVLDHRNWH